MAPETNASDEPVLPGIESFDDDRPSDETATARFDNGARLRTRIDENRQFMEAFHPDDEDEPTVQIERSVDFENAAQFLINRLINYEAYRKDNKYEQIREHWEQRMAETLAGVAEADTSGYTEQKLGTCCEDPDYEVEEHDDSGTTAFTYTRCTNCGTKWRDVYSYLHSERKV